MAIYDGRFVKIEKGKEDNVICLVDNSHIAEVRTYLFLPYIKLTPPLSYYGFTFRLFQNGGHRRHPATMYAKIIVHGGVYHRSAATEEVEDGIREVISFSKTFSKSIGTYRLSISIPSF